MIKEGYLRNYKNKPLSSGTDIDIQAQLHEDHDEKAQAYEVKNPVHDSIQDLGRPITRGRLWKVQEALQYKVANLMKAIRMEETRLITYQYDWRTRRRANKDFFSC